MNTEEQNKKSSNDEAAPPQIDPDELQQFTADIIHSQMHTPDRIYVDLALLKDISIGAIMAMAFDDGPAQAERAFMIIRDALPAYRRRYFFDPAHYFKEAGYSAERIAQALADPAMAGRIYRYAPSTAVIEILFKHLMINANHSEVMGKTSAISLDVNIWPLELDVNHKSLVGLFLSEALKVNVKIIRRQLDSFTLDEILEYDEYYVYHINEFSRNMAIHKGLSELKFLDKRLFAIPICGTTFDAERTDAELSRELVQADAAMRPALNTYKHIPITDCSPALPPKEAEDASSETPDPEE